MDLDRALRVFKAYYYLYEKDRSQAEGMLLTEGEKQAIAELEKLITNYSALVADKTGPVSVKAA